MADQLMTAEFVRAPDCTIGSALERAAGVLAAAGIADARREAEELYAALVCGAVSAAWRDRDRRADSPLLERLSVAAERRASGMPQAYATGRANFRGHWLAVDRRVLIPRPETEGLVELVIEWANAPTRGRAGPHGGNGASVRRCVGAAGLPLVADVGTGSGCIAIALALEAPVAGVIATDVSADALNVALDNAAALGVQERLSFRRGDLLEPLLDDRVDALVCNPPYVAGPEWEALDPSVRDYEPRLALDGGPDGLGPTRRLVEAARGALTPGGLLALEVDARRAEATADIVRGALFERDGLRLDLFGRPRYVLGRQPEA